MNRTIQQWQGMVPEIVAYEASEAHIMYALADAQEDIIQLYKLAARIARLNKDAGEIGAGMLASLVDEANRIILKV